MAGRQLWVELSTPARAGVDIQHYSFSEKSMADEYFLSPQPSWANSHLDKEVTYFQLMSHQKFSRPLKEPSHGILPSLQHVPPRELAVAPLGQVDTIHLSLLLSSQPPSAPIISHTDSDTVYNCFAVLKSSALPLWLPLHCQSVPALHHGPLHVYKVLPPLPPSDSFFLLSPLSINLEGSQHVSEGWAVGPQKNLTVLFHVI